MEEPGGGGSRTRVARGHDGDRRLFPMVRLARLAALRAARAAALRGHAVLTGGRRRQWGADGSRSAEGALVPSRLGRHRVLHEHYP